MTYWQFWHKKVALASGDNTYFNTDQATAGTKETTNWETASKVPYPLQIQAVSLVVGSENVLANVNKFYDPGTYIELFTGNTRIFEQLAAYAISGTGLLVNFSLASAAAQQFTTIGHPDPNSLFKIPGGIQLHNGEAFYINLHIASALGTPAAGTAATIVLHCNRTNISYST